MIYDSIFKSIKMQQYFCFSSMLTSVAGKMAKFRDSRALRACLHAGRVHRVTELP